MESYELKTRLPALGFWLPAFGCRLPLRAFQILVSDLPISVARKTSQPRSGDRVQPTAQAVGDPQKIQDKRRRGGRRSRHRVSTNF
jgi:hypothetical protein